MNIHEILVTLSKFSFINIDYYDRNYFIKVTSSIEENFYKCYYYFKKIERDNQFRVYINCKDDEYIFYIDLL